MEWVLSCSSEFFSSKVTPVAAKSAQDRSAASVRSEFLICRMGDLSYASSVGDPGGHGSFFHGRQSASGPPPKLQCLLLWVSIQLLRAESVHSCFFRPVVWCARRIWLDPHRFRCPLLPSNANFSCVALSFPIVNRGRVASEGALGIEVVNVS